MKTVEAYIKTPLGTARILGSSQGIEILEIRDKDHPVSDAIPSELINCAEQLNAYFLGSRKSFDLKLNPKGTAFQKLPLGASSSWHSQLGCRSRVSLEDTKQ